MGAEGFDKAPLLFRLPSELDQGDGIVRTGTQWSATAHIITAVIGSGVLSLAWAVGQLGWIAGPIVIFAFAAVTVFQSTLLAHCYKSPDPDHGPIRHRSYMQAVRYYLGEKSLWVAGIFQQTGLFGAAVAQTLTSAKSMRAIQQSNCYHKEGHQAQCSYGDSFYMKLFGVVQIVLCLIPDFHDMAWLSNLAAIMSFTYSSIGFGLGLAKVIGDGKIKGSISGIAMPSTTQKVWRVSQAIGDIAFAYPYAIVLLEIEDTLKSSPPEHQTMKKASRVAVLITTFFYLCCGCFGYAAFGDATPGNLLTGFGFYEPYWLIDFANLCVVIHLLGSYQVYSRPVFSFIDRLSAEKFPDSQFVTKFYMVKLPYLPPYRLNLLRFCFRTVYVITATGLAVYFPFFNQVLGLLGSFSFWPMAINFPVEMYLKQSKVTPWSKLWVVLQSFRIVCFIVSIFAFVGSVEGIISAKIS